MNQNQMYEQKYLKYKQKYLQLKAELEGGLSLPNPFAKKGPDSPEMAKLVGKQKNVNEKIAMLKEQISAQVKKEESEKKLHAATASLEAANNKAGQQKDARKAANAAASVTDSSSSAPAAFLGGLWNPFASSSKIGTNDSAAVKALKTKLKSEEDSLVTVNGQISSLQKVEKAQADAVAAAAKHEAVTAKAAQQKLARQDSKSSLAPSSEPSSPVANNYW
jgi:hypothetical protein